MHTVPANTPQLAAVRAQVLPDWRRQDSNRGKLDKNAKQAWRQRLRGFMTRKRTRDDKQELEVFTKRLLANKHHLSAGDQALRVAAGFGLARFCPQVRLAALTEHEERYSGQRVFASKSS